MPDLAGKKILYVGYCGPIDDNGVSKIASVLNQAVNDQFDAVYLTMSSHGGFVDHGIYLYHHIRSLDEQLEVTIHNTGMIGSIAAAIYAGAKHRVACENSMFMIHPVQNTPQGAMTHTSLQSILTSALADEERIDKILRERAAIPDDVLTRRRGMEVFFTAQQALEYGLVNEVGNFVLPPGNQIFHL